MFLKRTTLLAALAGGMLVAAGQPAQAGGYGYGGYGDCADDWRYCDRYLRDDAPHYYHRGYHGRRHHHGYRHRGYRDYSYSDHGYGYSDYGYGEVGYSGFVVCDPDGDRCYRSREPYWNYRTYYRRHGYHWLD